MFKVLMWGEGLKESFTLTTSIISPYTSFSSIVGGPIGWLESSTMSASYLHFLNWWWCVSSTIISELSSWGQVGEGLSLNISFICITK